MKKTPGDIIILHKCTKNHDHILYCSWHMACDRCNCYFSFWAIFCHFTSVTAQKMRISKKWKKKMTGDITTLHECTRNHDHMLYRFSDMACDRCNCYFSIWAIFCPFTPLTAQKMKMSKKNEKKTTTGDIFILHKCTKNHDHMLYCSWDIVHDGCNCYFWIWVIFCPFTPVTAWKMKIKKEHLEISSFTQVYQKS